MSSYPAQKYEWWIPNWNINRKVITQEIPYLLGPDATVRPYTNEGDDGFLITTSGACLTDEQIADICEKSRVLYEKKVAARSSKDTDKELKCPLHKPVIVRGRPSGHGHRRHDERDGGSRPHRGSNRGYSNRGRGESSRS